MSTTGAKSVPPKPPSPSMVPPALGMPKPSISPRNTDITSGKSSTAIAKVTKGSAANQAAAAAIFGDDLKSGDTEDDEFEFSLASRDGATISASASHDFDRAANSSLMPVLVQMGVLVVVTKSQRRKQLKRKKRSSAKFAKFEFFVRVGQQLQLRE